MRLYQNLENVINTIFGLVIKDTLNRIVYLA